MAWVAVNWKHREEVIFSNKPRRMSFCDETFEDWHEEIEVDFCKTVEGYGINLPDGTIRKLIDRDMSWMEEPIELK